MAIGCAILGVFLITSCTSCTLWTNTQKTKQPIERTTQKFVIIGSGAAGQGAVRELKSLIKQGKIERNSSITWVSAEKETKLYNRTSLVDYLTNMKKSRRFKFSDDNRRPRWAYRFNAKVLQIDAAQKSIVLDNGESIYYDKLVLGIGTSPSKLAVLGIDTAGVFPFYSLQDVNSIKTYVANNAVRHAVVLGAGLNGLECADALQKLGLSVSLLNRSQHVLNRKIDGNDAVRIEKAMLAKGVQHYSNAIVEKILQRDGKISGVELSAGKILPADLLVSVIGGYYDTSLAEQAGLKLHDRGIVVDEYMRTSNEHIFAAGDIVVVKDRVTDRLVHSEKWGDAKEQGALAARSMAGIVSKPYQGTVIASRASVFGMRIFISGHMHSSHEDYQVISKEDNESYYRLFFKDNRLKGFFIVNPSSSNMLKIRRAISTQEAISQPLKIFL